MTPQLAETGSAQRRAPGDETLQVLMLGLGDEILAIETSMVREIIDPVPATPVAGARPFVPAVANVRGNIIPLADLHVRFGLPKPPTSSDTRIVVMEISIDGEPLVVGLTADKVYEVTELSLATKQQTPRLGGGWRPEFIRVVAKWRDDFVIVPDLETVFA